MVLMEVEHNVWITFGIRSSVFLSGVFLNLTGDSYTRKKEVLTWYTSQSLDKRQIVHPVWWYLNRDPFLKGQVCSCAFRKKHCSWLWSAHLETPVLPPAVLAAASTRCAQTPVFLSGLGAPDLADCLSHRTHERLWHPCCQMLSSLCAPKTQKQVALGLYDGNVLLEGTQGTSKQEKFFKRKKGCTNYG